MDPTAVLRNILVSILENERDTALEGLDALSNWLDHGGFMPCVSDALILPLGMMRDRKDRGEPVQKE